VRVSRRILNFTTPSRRGNLPLKLMNLTLRGLEVSDNLR
jgi:hypothetical protein